MIKLNGKAIVTELLEERVLLSNEVSSNFEHNISSSYFTPSHSRPKALEKFKRWKQRTHSIIYQYINKFEAKRFWDLPTNAIYLFSTNQFASSLAIAQIITHAESIKSLIETIDDNHIRINHSNIENWSYHILLRLANKADQSLEQIADGLNINVFELLLYIKQLEKLQLTDWYSHSGQIRITKQGSKELEIYLEKSKMEKINETFASKEYRVLRAIYELSNPHRISWIMIDAVLEKVKLPYDLVNQILIDLEERKGLIDANESMVKIKVAGIEQIEQTKTSPDKPTKDFSVQNINNYNTFNASVAGVQQQTERSSQYVSQTVSIVNNPDFDSAIATIMSLVKESSLTIFKKEDLISDIERIKKLAENEPSEELVEHAKSKIKYLETAIKATDLATKVAPHIPQLYAFFEGLLKTTGG